MIRAAFIICLAAAPAAGLPVNASAIGPEPFSAQPSVVKLSAKDMISPNAGGKLCLSPAIDVPIRLVEVVNTALCNNPQTRQVWANVKAQEAQVGLSESAFLPSVNAGYSVAKGSAGTHIKDIPQLSYDVRTTTRDSSVNLSWTLFDFGLRATSLENARQLLAAANATQDATIQQVFLAAAQAYYDLLTAQAALDASKEAERAASESFLAADAKYKAGVGSLADKLLAQTNFAQSTSNRVKNDGDLKDAHGTLAVTMGLKVNAAFLLSPDAMDSPLPDTTFVRSVDTLINESISRHPSLIAARSQLKAALASVGQAKAEGMPSIALSGGYDHNDQLGQYPRDTFTNNKSIGIQVKIPLFEGFGRSYRIQAAQAQVEAKRADVANMEQQLSLGVWKSYQSLQTQTENLRATDELLRSAAQSFEVAQGRYKAGVGNILELLNAQSALASAKQQHILTLSNWRTARLNLAASLGNLGLWAIE